MTLPKFTNPPPPTQHCLLIFPTPETPLVTLNRPESLNCVNSHGHAELHAVWEWMDAEPLLRVGIITGKGKRLVLGLTSKVRWNGKNSQTSGHQVLRPSGFVALSRAKFTLPEVNCGVIALVGGMMRLVRTVGKRG
ncbi:enoyl-CoA hydratase [Histoplasma capsulatum var. duboisii H88]|uniref:Enoyl-CoA hydratase n=1 Tax=Ajellomyces capsulatus (strain H88) TaxID=544711 RepID=F0UHA1_AJEC8|nr:enoyl-CoA hydratase [Histoplasma capsulatum var. duboisii H88]